jgi:hypothetical protein
VDAKDIPYEVVEETEDYVINYWLLN